MLSTGIQALASMSPKITCHGPKSRLKLTATIMDSWTPRGYSRATNNIWTGDVVLCMPMLSRSAADHRPTPSGSFTYDTRKILNLFDPLVPDMTHSRNLSLLLSALKPTPSSPSVPMSYVNVPLTMRTLPAQIGQLQWRLAVAMSAAFNRKWAGSPFAPQIEFHGGFSMCGAGAGAGLEGLLAVHSFSHNLPNPASEKECHHAPYPIRF